MASNPGFSRSNTSGNSICQWKGRTRRRRAFCASPSFRRASKSGGLAEEGEQVRVVQAEAALAVAVLRGGEERLDGQVAGQPRQAQGILTVGEFLPLLLVG
jgi:hypothetical protein